MSHVVSEETNELLAISNEAERNAAYRATGPKKNSSGDGTVAVIDGGMRKHHHSAATFAADGTVELLTPDQAQSQKVINTITLARALEECENLLSMQESSVSYIVNKTPVYNLKFKDSQEAVDDVEERYRWCAPCGWSMGRVIDTHNMILSEEDIKRYNAQGTPVSSEVRVILQELATTKLSKSRVVHRREALKAFNKFAPLNIADVTIGLYEYLHTDVLAHAKQELSRTDVAKARILKQIDQHGGLREEAHVRGDVGGIEEQHRCMIDQFTELLELLASRLDQLLSSGEDTQHFRNQLNTITKDAEESYSLFDSSKKKLLEDTIADLSQTEKVSEDENKNHLSSINDYVEKSATSMKKLKDNTNQQDQVLAVIRQQFEKLQGLGEDRRTMVEAHLKAKQAEENRIASFLEFSVAQQHHHAELLQLKDHAEGCCAVSSLLLDYKNKMSELLDQRLVEDELSGLSLEEGKAYLKHYRSSALCTGELVDKKRHRMDAMQRQSRQVNLQRETAIESLDPDTARYNSELQSLANQMDACQATVVHMQSLQDLHADNFKRTEDFLRKEGVAFTHPMVEQNERSAESRRKFIERTLRYVEEEERELDKNRESISKQKQLTQSEQEETQKRLGSKSSGSPTRPKSSGGTKSKKEEEGEEGSGGAVLAPRPPAAKPSDAVSPKKDIVDYSAAADDEEEK